MIRAIWDKWLNSSLIGLLGFTPVANIPILCFYYFDLIGDQIVLYQHYFCYSLFILYFSLDFFILPYSTHIKEVKGFSKQLQIHHIVGIVMGILNMISPIQTWNYIDPSIPLLIFTLLILMEFTNLIIRIYFNKLVKSLFLSLLIIYTRFSILLISFIYTFSLFLIEYLNTKIVSGSIFIMNSISIVYMFAFQIYIISPVWKKRGWLHINA